MLKLSLKKNINSKPKCLCRCEFREDESNFIVLVICCRAGIFMEWFEQTLLLPVKQAIDRRMHICVRCVSDIMSRTARVKYEIQIEFPFAGTGFAWCYWKNSLLFSFLFYFLIRFCYFFFFSNILQIENVWYFFPISNWLHFTVAINNKTRKHKECYKVTLSVPVFCRHLKPWAMFWCRQNMLIKQCKKTCIRTVNTENGCFFFYYYYFTFGNKCDSNRSEPMKMLCVAIQRENHNSSFWDSPKRYLSCFSSHCFWELFEFFSCRQIFSNVEANKLIVASVNF